MFVYRNCYHGISERFLLLLHWGRENKWCIPGWYLLHYPPVFVSSFVLAVLSYTVIPAQEWDTAKLSSCTTRDSMVAGRCSGWHAAQLQVNTSRDSATAVPLLKYVFISPATPHAQSKTSLRCLSCPVSHIPPSSVQPLGKLFTKGLLFAHHKWHP